MKRLIVLLIAACVSLPTAGLAAGDESGGVGTDAATTVKSGKSNSSERSTTVKSSKSNGSERLGGDEAAAAEGRVKGSKSNTSERATSVHSGKSNSDN